MCILLTCICKTKKQFLSIVQSLKDMAPENEHSSLPLSALLTSKWMIYSFRKHMFHEIINLCAVNTSMQLT